MAWFLICMKINCHSSQLSLSNQAVHLSCNSCHCALDTQLFGVIHQLCGPNFTQLWPPTLLEWTNVEILHTTYPLFTQQSVDFLVSTDHLPTCYCPRSNWTTQLQKWGLLLTRSDQPLLLVQRIGWLKL